MFASVVDNVVKSDDSVDIVVELIVDIEVVVSAITVDVVPVLSSVVGLKVESFA